MKQNLQSLTLGGQFQKEVGFTLPITADERHIVVIQKKKETPKNIPENLDYQINNRLNKMEAHT